VTELVRVAHALSAGTLPICAAGTDSEGRRLDPDRQRRNAHRVHPLTVVGQVAVIAARPASVDLPP
jgi:hypothetical protein